MPEVGHRLSAKLSSSQQMEGNVISYMIHNVHKMKIKHVAPEKCDYSSY